MSAQETIAGTPAPAGTSAETPVPVAVEAEAVASQQKQQKQEEQAQAQQKAEEAKLKAEQQKQEEQAQAQQKAGPQQAGPQQAGPPPVADVGRQNEKRGNTAEGFLTKFRNLLSGKSNAGIAVLISVGILLIIILIGIGLVVHSNKNIYEARFNSDVANVEYGKNIKKIECTYSSEIGDDWDITNAFSEVNNKRSDFDYYRGLRETGSWMLGISLPIILIIVYGVGYKHGNKNVNNVYYY